jgi:hypothetical protein
MTTQKVHAGDRGTKYWYRLQRNGVAYDPSEAETTTLIFRMPGGTVEKDAEVEQVDDDWFLTYTVEVETFHADTGRMSIQPHLTFADGQEYHGDIKRIGDDGSELRIYKNLETGSPS